MPDPVDPAPEAERGPITWHELVRDFLKPGRAQVVVAAILLIIGLGVSMQVRSRSEETDYSQLRRDELIQVLDDLNAESRRLEAEIGTLEETRRQLQTGADRQRVAREEAQRRLDVLSILGGTLPAQGPGIRITITDPNAKVTPEILLNAVQELRDAGGEVISINSSIRVVAGTWFGIAAGGLTIDSKPVTRPIVIEVIGDPHALTEAVRFRGGLVSDVQNDRVGGQVAVATQDRLVISAVTTVRPPAYARPA